MDSYSFAEDADPEDVEVYVTATVDPAYPRGPSLGIAFVVKSHADTASHVMGQDDYGRVNAQAGVAATDFGDEGGSQVARYLLEDTDGDKFAPVSDEVYEGDETLALEVSNRSANRGGLVRFKYADGTFCTATCTDIRYPVTITDEGDLPSLTLAADPASIAEADDAGTTDVAENASTLTVAIDNAKTFAADQTLTLTFAGTATYGTHYTVAPADTDTNALGHQVTLAATDSSATVTVTAVDDAIVNADRTVEVTGTRDGTQFGAAVTVTITDDESSTDTTPPAFSSAEVDGTALTITFDEARPRQPRQRRLRGQEDPGRRHRGERRPERHDGAGHQRRHRDPDPGHRGCEHRHRRQGQLHQTDRGQRQPARGRRRQRGGELHRPAGDQRHRRHHRAAGERNRAESPTTRRPAPTA